MSNFLLLLILAVLMFGSGAVLGFFNTLFWIIFFTLLIIGFIFLIPQIGKNIAEEQKQAYRKHPMGVIFFSVVALVVFLLFIFSLISKSTEQSEKAFIQEVQNSPQYQSLPTQETNSTAYPNSTRTAFMENCNKTSGGQTDKCNCLLNYLEANYSIDQFSQLETDYLNNRQYPKAFTEAIQYCENQ